jgi:hypothetical protein
MASLPRVRVYLMTAAQVAACNAKPGYAVLTRGGSSKCLKDCIPPKVRHTLNNSCSSLARAGIAPVARKPRVAKRPAVVKPPRNPFDGLTDREVAILREGYKLTQMIITAGRNPKLVSVPLERFIKVRTHKSFETALYNLTNKSFEVYRDLKNLNTQKSRLTLPINVLGNMYYGSAISKKVSQDIGGIISESASSMTVTKLFAYKFLLRPYRRVLGDLADKSCRLGEKTHILLSPRAPGCD